MQNGKGALAEWKAGWPLPLVSAIGVAVVNIPHYSLGMFFAPLERDLGWSRAQASSGVFALSAIAIFAIPLMGRLIDVKGARRIALSGIVLFCLMLAALGLAQPQIWTWWALWMLLAIAGALVSPVIWTAAVASRFDKGRGLALAVTLSGAGIGTAMGPLLSNWLIHAYGWRMAYAGMGAIFCAIMLPLVFLFFFSARDLDRRPADEAAAATPSPAPGMSFAEGIRNGKFQRLVLATFLIAFGLLALVIHFAPILTGFGISTDRAAEAAALVGVGSITGRVLAGFLLDRIRGTIVGGVAFAAPVLVSLALLQWGGDPQMIFVIAFLLGLSLGSEVDVVAYLTSRYVGLRNFGALFGISISALALATGSGPWVAGLIYDAFGSYHHLLIGVMPLFLLSALLIASLGPEPVFEA